MNYNCTLKRIVIAIAIAIITSVKASAAINLVTAKVLLDNRNDRIKSSSDGGNTWNQNPDITGSHIEFDNKWSEETRAGMIEGVSLYKGDSDSVPTLRLTIATNLTPGYNYNLFGYFYNAGNWGGLGIGTDPSNLPFYYTTGITAIDSLTQQQRDDRFVGFDGLTGTANTLNDWLLRETPSIAAQVSGDGNLYVYVDRGNMSRYRTVIQGIGYEFVSVPETEVYALISGVLTLGFVVIRRRLKS